MHLCISKPIETLVHFNVISLSIISFQMIRLVIHDLVIENQTGCSSDELAIHEGVSKIPIESGLCGSLNNVVLHSLYSLHLHFVSDGKNETNGFKFEVNFFGKWSLCVFELEIWFIEVELKTPSTYPLKTVNTNLCSLSLHLAGSMLYRLLLKLPIRLCHFVSKQQLLQV